MIRNITIKMPLLLILGLMVFNSYCQTIKPFNTTLNFEEADKKANEILQQMTLDEKIELIAGDDMLIRGIKRLNIPPVITADATQGVRLAWDEKGKVKWGVGIEKSTAFPAPILLASTWNPQLSHDYAKSIGEECRAGNIRVLLGPGMNIYRISQNGRNFEYFGEDPFLAARMIENYVKGLQSTGTIATLKHFLGNQTEFKRRRSNSIVDERALQEIYMPAFEAGIDAGALAVMTAYNQINGEWTGQSHYVINKLLKKDLGFKWLVMSDWWSVYDGEKVSKSGLDLEMPWATSLKGIKEKIDQGKVLESDIDRMAKSILRTCFAMGIYNSTKMNGDVNYDAHELVALNTAREGTILLKNSNAILPLSKAKNHKILITGKYAAKFARGGGAAYVKGYNNVVLLDALKTEFGNQIEYKEKPSIDELKQADIVLASIGTFDEEGSDRPFNLPEEDENQILKIVEANKNTIVIVNSGSGIKMTNWADKVAAIIYGWYPGQIGNVALAEILSGKTNPSGKLPISIEKHFENTLGYPYLPTGEEVTDPTPEHEHPVYDVNYNEGVFVGYRWYDSKKVEPLFPFGHGLSYSNFSYKKLHVTPQSFTSDNEVIVSFEVKNTSKVAGSEVVQVYVSDIDSSVPRPEKELKGFLKVYLQPGESKQIEIVLNNRSFSFWDINTKQWKAESGKFRIQVGSSSKEIKLNTIVKMK
ncbi:glycoside hydrolase family 3 C-terminal domain-containing protein [Mariniflexile litorale]|uniref:Glycoside hydrolase family 3 C-terminal domain-containing protein n=1 Tax=Mariniflexile litorale TaxID=3045158 RepID=A0AAU7EGH0_9FLAO|nr:glycoside hydrolase family 3 C-terminal domain-containing protein [Mariniflexile sp. KMM 9835]MDQ8211957.1 glycoside hydrolase family 3 C-terminal domain-containing protein [Mariniflexile sp. KMM 9835]